MRRLARRSRKSRSRREHRELIDQMIVLYQRCYDARLRQDPSPRGRSGRSRQLPPVIVMRSPVLLCTGLFAIGSFGLFGFGDAKAQALSAPLVVAQLQDMPAPKPMGATSGLAAPPSTDERAPNANPLWTIPLTNLTATRERPVFSPSRRPPPAPVVATKAAAPPPPPPKPAEPEKPQLSLVGTILGESGEGIGLFMIPADHTGLSLKTGQDHNGWILREVRARQVVLEKEQQTAILELPTHDMSKVGSVVPPAAPANRKAGAVVDEVAAKSSVNNPKPTGGFSPSGPPVVVPTLIVQPPPSEPQVNPFEKAWLSTKRG